MNAKFKESNIQYYEVRNRHLLQGEATEAMEEICAFINEHI